MQTRVDVMSEVMDAVEARPAGAAGLLLYGARAEASVVVAVTDRRVSWATATHVSCRLGDLLALRTSLDRAEVRSAWTQSRLSHERVGEWLVDRGWITPAELLVCLLEQALQAIGAVAADMGEPLWVPDFLQATEHTLSPAVLRRAVAPRPTAPPALADPRRWLRSTLALG
jgi:hypothetical protein